MKKLRMTQKEVILLPSFDKSMYEAVLNAKLSEAGFDLGKPITREIDSENKDVVYVQH